MEERRAIIRSGRKTETSLNMARAALIREGERERNKERESFGVCIGRRTKAADAGPAPRYRRSKMRSKNCRQFELLIRTMRESSPRVRPNRCKTMAPRIAVYPERRNERR